MALDYFTLEEFRALPDMDDDATYTDAKVTAAAEFFQAIVEGECQTSFVPRTVTETLDTWGGTSLTLATPYVRAITSVTIDGTLSTDSFSAAHGVLQRVTTGTYTPLSWGYGHRNVVVVYTASYSTTPPADIKDAVMWATRDRLISQNSENGHDPRLASMTNDLGGSTTYVLPGEKRPSGYPELDAVIARWARKLNTVTFP